MNIHQRNKLLALLTKRQSAAIESYFHPLFRHQYHLQRWYGTEATTEAPEESSSSSLARRASQSRMQPGV